jgi:hypothetical protein
MKFKEYLEQLNHMAKKWPEVLEMETVAIDINNGGEVSYSQVEELPGVGLMIGDKFRETWSLNNKRSMEFPNSVCIL